MAHHHTHDEVDWAARAERLQVSDSLLEAAFTQVAARLTAGFGPGSSVLDIGSGAGGMSAALAAELGRRGGGRLVLVDAVPELLALAEATARKAGGETVRIETVVGDAAAEDLSSFSADLIWASFVVHHLPDQQAALRRIASGLRPGGRLALAEGGLQPAHLPRDLGVGRPGLEARLAAARAEWFTDMRNSMKGALRLPYGWDVALREAGLAEVSSFSYLVDCPAPLLPAIRSHVVDGIKWMAEVAADWLEKADVEVLEQLLDPGSEHFLGARDDLFVLEARTVYHGLAR